MPLSVPLQRFIHSLGAEPEKIRKSFLASAASLTKARNAFLLVPGKSGLLYLKRQPLVSGLDVELKDFENGTKDILQIGKILLVRLKSHARNSNAGVLILLFARATKRTSNLRQWIAPLCRVYVCWQVSQNLRSTIEAQQKTLQSLSAESATVAQEYVRLTQQMHTSQLRMQSITKGILKTQEEERAKISRDLHDGIGQELTALKMNLDILSPVVEKILQADHQERWKEARLIAEQALQDVRELSRLLRPRMLDDLGLFPTVRWYVRSFIKRTNLPVALELVGDEETLTTDTQTILFRVIQEALNNVAKHSNATSAAVKLSCSEDEVRLSIQDDGIGFDPSVRPAEMGSGLAGMRDRVSLYRGTFAVHSAPNQGTQVNISIPL